MKEREKRICVVRHGYYPEDPRVYKEVRALVEAGYGVDVICLRKRGAAGREKISGVQVYRVPLERWRGSKISYILEYGLSILMMGAVLSFLYCCRRYACIQVNTLPDFLVFVAALPKLCGARILLDMHEPTPELMLTKHDITVHSRMLRVQYLLEHLAIRYAHRVITVNDTIRQRFIERGADPDRISVVRNVPSDDFEALAPPRKPHDGFIIMTHGTVQPRYGQSLLLRALPIIRQEFSTVQLIIAGAGEALEELKNLSSELNCDDLITFTGQISREGIAELIAGADVGIVPLMPGPFSELCQPNKLFEYIALKIPVVASRLPAIEESFDETCIRFFRPGDVADLADSVIQLGRSALLRESLAEHAFSRYRDMHWSRTKKQYVDIIHSLITGDGLHAE